jgi:diguanylate cyclase (GGDEF)-like protein
LQEGRIVTVPEPNVAELRPLARSMNTMVNRLSTMFDAQARQVEGLRQQVQTDPLTGLLNRRHFMLEAQQRFESSAGAAQGLLLLRVGDLDGLNRRCGHAAVDQMLRDLAAALRELLAAQDQPLLGRLNGSDFAAVMSRDDASALARELLPRLRDVAQRLDAQASLCAGAADSAQAAGLQAAIAAADQALAQAESQGPFTVIGRPCSDHSATLGERDWQRQLSEALQEGRSSLGEYPVCNAQGALLQLDCPLRVQLQRGGAFEPASNWLALATRSRLTTALDLRATSLALESIERDGVARCVNLAAASLLATEFVAEISALLQAKPHAARQLWIDMPESLAAAHPAVIQEVSRHWRGLGARVGLEHAGAALAGMARLYEIGVDYVRIDARYLADIGNDADVRRHAEGLLTLLRGIGLSVYAEGVVHAADLQVLWTLGFDGATGPGVTPR